MIETPKIEETQLTFSMEGFIDNRLKVGRSQYRQLFSLALVEINDGVQAITISLLTPILKQQLHLTQNQVSFLASVFYIGVGSGAIASGISANIYGRKKILLLGSLIQLISSIMLSFNFSYGWLCFCRLIYGIGYGSTFAVATVIITELMPMKLRGKTLLVINFINSFGKLGCILLAFIFIEGEKKHISQYMLVSAFLNLITIIMASIHVKQSFRFLMFRKKFTQTFQIMNQIIKENSKNNEILGQNEKELLKNWSIQTFEQTQSNMNSFKLIVQEKRNVILLSFSSFFINFIFFGQMFIIPFMVGNKEEGLAQYFWMTLGEIPGFLLAYSLIEREGWGRRRSLIWFFTTAAILCLIATQLFNSITLLLTKMLMKAIFQMITPFSLQSYSTSIRSIAYSINSLFGRLGATLMPFIIYPLYNMNPNSPFLYLGILSLLGALSIRAVRKDTLGKDLDDSGQNIVKDNKEAVQLSDSSTQPNYCLQQEI